LQSRKHSRLALARHLWLLATFGIIHGVYEWGSVFIPLQQSALAAESPNVLLILQMTLEAISFLALFQFGIELLALGSPIPGLIRGLPTVMLGVWEATMLILQNSSGQSFSGYFDTGDTLARYLLGVPGGVAAAWGLWRQAQQVTRMDLPRIANYLRGAAYAFAVYAVASAVVPSAIFFPASVFNYAALTALVGIPAEIFRAGCGVMIAYLIIRGLEIFEVETDRLLEEAAQQRAVAVDRERIGRELHDNIIQALYATGLTLEDASLTVDEDAPRAKYRLGQAIQALNETIGDIRRYILDLRSETGNDDWQADLGEMVRAFRLETLIDTELMVVPAPPAELGSKASKEILAIAREALTNVTKHARATQVRVQVTHPPETTQLEIIDNGIGMASNGDNPASVSDRQGLRNMRERAAIIGARLEIESEPQRGTTVRLVLPNTPHESQGTAE
jgi:signal transduction histidine kinase